jgi:hypothetical protein
LCDAVRNAAMLAPLTGLGRPHSGGRNALVFGACRWTRDGLVSCGSAGNCAVGGLYHTGPTQVQAFVVTEVNGKWGNAVAAPGVPKLSGIGGFGEINSISCASAGNCAGAGQYNDSTSRSQAFVIVQRNGSWSAAIKVPGLAALNKGDSASAAVVSCRPPGGCAAGGFYHDARSRQQPFVLASQ